MTHKLICTVLLMINLLYSGTSFGQTEKNQRELYKDYLEGVNKSELLTKFFLNRGFISKDEVELLPQFVESYTEDTNELIPPMSQMDAVSWKQIYLSLLESEINPVKMLADLTTINNQIGNNPIYTKNIPLLIFDVKGELLEHVEIESSIANSPKLNPYNQIHLLGVMGHKSDFYSKTVHFSLNLENYFTDTYPKPAEIYIDFSDGRGIQRYSTSQGLISITYADLGEKAIQIYKNTILNGSEVQIGSSFEIEIKSEDPESLTGIITSQSPSIFRLTNSNSEIISNAGAVAYIYNDDKTNTFDKPFIVVQGFDPIGQITKESQIKKYARFSEELQNSGYDMVYVIFKNTNLSLSENTNFLKGLLKKINLNKEKNYESVIIGESMGGLLTRMALKELENENYDHKVGLYVSFDAPHQGANIPPGFQYLFKDVMNSTTVSALTPIINIVDKVGIALARIIISIFSDKPVHNLSDILGVNMAYKALAALDSPAAKSMLVRHINPGNYFTSTQNYLNQLGYPAASRNIALINGSNSNQIPSFKPGTELIHFPLWNDLCNELSLNAWSSPTNTTARVSQIKWSVGIPVPDIQIVWQNKCVRIFGTRICTKVPIKVQVGTTCASTNLQNTQRYYSFNNASYDNAPGSTFAVGDNLPFDLKADATFVPIASAIDVSQTAYDNNTNPNGLNVITSESVLNNFINTNMTPFDDVYSDYFSSTHVKLFATNSIITNEIMPLNLNIQNKDIIFNRDFDAQDITIGNAVNDILEKSIIAGDVVIKPNANVNINATNQILLKPGTVIKTGSNVSLKINNLVSSTITSSSRISGSKLSPKKINFKDFDIQIIGKKDYSTGELPSFKVLVSNLDSDYQYIWELIGNSNVNGSKEEFRIDKFLNSGLYTIKVTVTSKTTNETHSLSKVFKVKSSFENQNDVKDILKLNTIITNVIIYPNPASNEATIIAEKEIQNIKIIDLTGKILFENKNICNSWSTLNVSLFSSGIYTINVVFKDGSTTNIKLIKK